MWTHFWDMYSGGGLAQPPYDHIFIQADKLKAVGAFQDKFHHDPNEINCECCGENYSISECESLSQATGFHRNCRTVETLRYPTSSLYLEKGEDVPEGYSLSKFQHTGQYQTLEEFKERSDVLVIYEEEL